MTMCCNNYAVYCADFNYAKRRIRNGTFPRQSRMYSAVQNGERALEVTHNITMRLIAITRSNTSCLIITSKFQR